jgi:trimeric autotransporter adhesin
MKFKPILSAVAPVLSALLASFNFPLSTAYAQGTAFTYQGQLQNNGNPAGGTYNFIFTLFATNTGGTSIAGPLTNSAVSLSNGLFTVFIDFGASPWRGATNWLQIAVETNGGSAFTPLSPRQELTPTPYAIAAGSFDGTLGSASLSGTYTNPLAFNNAANQFTGIFSGNGAGVTNVNAATLGGLSAKGFWQSAGNAGTSPALGNFLGTTDNNPLALEVNGQRALLLAPSPVIGVSGAPNVVAGSPTNVVGAVSGATIAGGGAVNYPGYTATANSVDGDFGTVGGGMGNSAAAGSTVGGGGFNTAATYATVGGGFTNIAGGAGSFIGGGGYNGVGFGGNQATGAASVVVGGMANTAGGAGSFIGGGGYDGINTSGNTNDGAAATIAGGSGNSISAFAEYAFIGGGIDNAVGIGAQNATVGGGVGNVANAYATTVGGGYENTASGQYASVPGGYGNTAGGRMSFAAGGNATASDNNSFVWSDGSRSMSSQGANSFAILATGGVYLYTTNGTSVVLDNTGDLNFGATTRQMLNLWSTSYGIGVQDFDEYFRTAGQFYWFLNGSHNNTNGNSGGGMTLMTLSTSGLTVNGTFVSASDRNLKENFRSVDGPQVLALVSALPISRWNYKADPACQHLGPVAQDFYAAFGVGPDDKHIATVDESGVALAAIQGLNQKLEQQLKAKDAQIAALEAKSQSLEQRVEKLEKLVREGVQE